MSDQSTASTQLRALEGEIAEAETRPFNIAFDWRDCAKRLLVVARQLEKDCETQKQFYDNTRAHYESLRTEHATLTRRLDEAMKENEKLKQSKNAAVITLGYLESNAKAVLRYKPGHHCDYKSMCDSVAKRTENTLHRITEIDKL